MGRSAMVCVLHGERHEINPATLKCFDQSHEHISREVAAILEHDGQVEWIKKPANRKEKGIVRALKQNFSIRGLSCKVGAILANALKAKEPWAIVMLADTQRRTLPVTIENISFVASHPCYSGSHAQRMAASA